MLSVLGTYLQPYLNYMSYTVIGSVRNSHEDQQPPISKVTLEGIFHGIEIGIAR